MEHNSARAYKALAEELKGKYGEAEAMAQGVGGDFDAIGTIERELLVQHGLRPHHYLIDVGCGSGRLAKPLAEYLTGDYLGTDVVPEFVEFAKQITNRPGWRFRVTSGTEIPEGDGEADMVCFFSVFTHLLHELSYLYLREAKRVLKPGGLIVFSFLEFRADRHWKEFENVVAAAHREHALTVFLSRDAIEVWAGHLGLEVVTVIDGEQPHVPLQHPVTYDDGTVVEGLATLGPTGQSVCVLRKS